MAIDRKTILGRSKLLQRNPERSLQVIDIANEVYSEGDTEESLKAKIFQRHKDKYGSTIAITILLQVIVPIVVKLILEWWSNK